MKISFSRLPSGLEESELELELEEMDRFGEVGFVKSSVLGTGVSLLLGQTSCFVVKLFPIESHCANGSGILELVAPKPEIA